MLSAALGSLCLGLRAELTPRSFMDRGLYGLDTGCSTVLYCYRVSRVLGASAVSGFVVPEPLLLERPWDSVRFAELMRGPCGGDPCGLHFCRMGVLRAAPRGPMGPIMGAFGPHWAATRPFGKRATHRSPPQGPLFIPAKGYKTLSWGYKHL